MTATGGGGAPREVHIETTRACNLRCVQCAVSQPYYEVATLSWQAFERVLPFLRRHRPFVHLNGHGETLLGGSSRCSRRSWPPAAPWR